MKHYKRGYTSGVYDMLHIGHINIFKNAKKYCDYLLVAVSTDEVVEKNKNKKPIIPFKDRFEIVEIPERKFIQWIGGSIFSIISLIKLSVRRKWRQ